VVAVRPERVVLGSDAAGFDNRLPGTVEFVSYLGASIDVHVRVSPAERIVVSQPNRLDGLVPKEGERTEVCWPSAAAIVLS
jgi:putative spermidine/putrescine transport system ATP-binding protein